jgi:hypothetical protein
MIFCSRLALIVLILATVLGNVVGNLRTFERVVAIF